MRRLPGAVRKLEYRRDGTWQHVRRDGRWHLTAHVAASGAKPGRTAYLDRNGREVRARP